MFARIDSLLCQKASKGLSANRTNFHFLKAKTVVSHNGQKVTI